LIAFPDYPTQKLDRASPLDVKINDGLHYHGVILVHTESRLKIGLDIYMREHWNRYIREKDALKTMYIQPIDEPTAKTAVGYGFKALEWRIPDTDRIFVRPRAVSELPVGKQHWGPRSGVQAQEQVARKRWNPNITAPREPPLHRF
jgi:hypothetical protein